MTANPDWELIRTMLAVLREGSLTGAARTLGLTQPTVGRHIDTLEHQLDAPLFLRSPNGLAPTALALTLRSDAEAMAASAAALGRAASRSREGGTVRVTASEIIGSEILPAILAGLRRTHPRIAVELVLSNRTENLTTREADIAVRMVRPAQEALLARRLGTVELGLFAHPAYVAEYGTPADLEALARHALIGFDRENGFIRSLRPRGLAMSRDTFALRADSNIAQLALVRAGAGIGVCQTGLGHRYGLVRVLPGAVAIDMELWLAMHEDLRGDPHCRAVLDALGEGLAAYLRTG